MFDRVMGSIERVTGPLAEWASNNRYLRSIMTGILATLTLTIVGALAVLIGKPPVPEVIMKSSGLFPSILQGWATWGEQNLWIRGINEISTGIIGFAFTLAATFNLARHYKLNEISAVIISAMIYFMIVGQPQTVMVNDAPTLQVAMSSFGSAGVFSGIVITIVTVEIIRLFQTKNIGFRFPPSVPAYVQTSFNAILPGVASVVAFIMIDKGLLALFDARLPQLITSLMGPLVNNFDNVYMVGFFMILINFFWFLGIHGGSIVMPIILPIEIHNIVSNLNNYSAGLPYDKVFTTPVHFGFIAIGGAGVFALALLNSRSKSKGLRQVGKIGILPSVFNISEPTMFGTPIPFNSNLFIPFLMVPAVNTVITYAAFHWFELLSAPILNVPAQTPVILIAIAASASLKAGVVAIFIILVDLAIYYPFFKRMESKLIAEEKAEEEQLKAEQAAAATV
ncbi:PTS sugar transporter subunit IIC [Paenibacillus jiagnxiensis]|uniref:PTS sugar transporter subunit IIC n=1 Tax=Paenibacillus jiagnxiensis TaxID=3228926 RepID=UPI0033B942C1